MVLDRLAADVEALGDLRVAGPCPRMSRTSASCRVSRRGLGGAGDDLCRTSASCGGRLDVVCRAASARTTSSAPRASAGRPQGDRRLREPASASRDRASSIGICAWAKQARASRKEARGSPVPRPADPTASEGRRAADTVARVPLRRRRRAGRPPPRPRPARPSATCTSTSGASRGGPRQLPGVDLGQRPLQDVGGRPRDLAPGQVDGRPGRAAPSSTCTSSPANSCSASSQRPCRTRSSASRTQPPGRVAEPAAASPQSRTASVKAAVGFGPPPGRSQDPSVVRPAEGRHRRAGSAARPSRSPMRIHPSARSTSWACSQAENSSQKTSSSSGKPSTSSAGDRRQGLVEQRPCPVGPVAVDEARPRGTRGPPTSRSARPAGGPRPAPRGAAVLCAPGRLRTSPCSARPSPLRGAAAPPKRRARLHPPARPRPSPQTTDP